MNEELVTNLLTNGLPSLEGKKARGLVLIRHHLPHAIPSRSPISSLAPFPSSASPGMEKA